MGILLFVLKYISLILKMINGFSWSAKIIASPFNFSDKLCILTFIILSTRKTFCLPPPFGQLKIYLALLHFAQPPTKVFMNTP